MAPHGTNDETAVSVALDRAVPGAMHRRIVLVVCGAAFVDFYDLTMGGAIVGTLVRIGRSTPALNSMFFSASGVGAAIGVLGAGFLADAIGRRRTLQVMLALMTVGTLLCAVAADMPQLVAARGLAAVGMGAIPTIGYVYMAEVLPSRIRGTWISAGGILIASSTSVSSMVSFYLLPIGGWRWMFFIPAVAGLLLIGAAQLVPESPRWLAQKSPRRLGRAMATLGCGEDWRTYAAAVPDNVALGSFMMPTGRAALIRSIVLAALLATGANVLSNSYIAWLPTILLSGASISRGLGENFLVALGAPFGSVLAYLLSGRVGRRSGILSATLLGLLLAIACAFIERSGGLVLLAAILMAAVNLVCTLVLSIYIPELFPTAVRARGSSVALTFSRVALIVAPFVVSALLAANGRAGVMLFLAGCLVLIAMAVVAVGPETAGRPLADR